MNGLHESDICCPYCGEKITVLVDCSVQEQEYIEDCQVCCQPINFSVSIENNDIPTINVTHDNE